MTRTLASDLAQFTGSENWYQHWMKQCTYTDGVKFMAEQAGAFWLIDEVAINQMLPKVKAEEFQVWTLKTDLDRKYGVLTCDDGNGNVVFTKEIHFTDFPLPEIKLYFTDRVILLPSEY